MRDSKAILLGNRVVLGMTIALTLSNSLCWSREKGDSSKYLDAVREFADNVLTYGRGTCGLRHTLLFVDGLNIHTHEPVKWIAPNGDKWILSNLASQQIFLRTFGCIVGGDS
jgi:hypothetical protein